MPKDFRASKSCFAASRPSLHDQPRLTASVDLFMPTKNIFLNKGSLRHIEQVSGFIQDALPIRPGFDVLDGLFPVFFVLLL